MKINCGAVPDTERAVAPGAAVTAKSAATRRVAASVPAVRATPIGAEVAITIRRPRPEVGRVMFDPRYDPVWIGTVRRSALAARGPMGAGTKINREWHWLGRTFADGGEVVEHVPDRSMAFTTQLPLDLRVRYELEGIPEGTIARVCVAGRATGMLRFGAAALSALLRWGVIRDLDRLKALLESGEWRRVHRPAP